MVIQNLIDNININIFVPTINVWGGCFVFWEQNLQQTW